MTSSLDFFFEGLDDTERVTRLRELRALVAVYCGWEHPAKLAIDNTLTVGSPLTDALDEIARLPALQRRRVLASLGALMFDGW